MLYSVGSNVEGEMLLKCKPSVLCDDEMLSMRQSTSVLYFVFQLRGVGKTGRRPLPKYSFPVEVLALVRAHFPGEVKNAIPPPGVSDLILKCLHSKMLFESRCAIIHFSFCATFLVDYTNILENACMTL